jgi:hypothetical protein
LPAGRVLEPIERALAGQRRRRVLVAFELAEQHAQHRIVAKPVVVVQILVAERQAEHPLPDQRPQRMHRQERAAMVRETRGEPIRQPDRLVCLPQQQRAGVRRHHPAVEIRHHPAPAGAPKLHLRRATLRHHRGPLFESV